MTNRRKRRAMKLALIETESVPAVIEAESVPEVIEPESVPAVIEAESVPKASAAPQTDTSTKNQHSEFFRMKALEEFLKLNPPLFEGRPDSSAALNWLNTVKAMFDSAGVLPEFRVGFAVYLFEGLAEEWYDGYAGKTRWKKFEAAFRQTYNIASANPSQNSMTVEAYRALFDKLSLNDPTMFLEGVRCTFREQIVQFPISDFDLDELYVLAMRVEADFYRWKRMNKSKSSLGSSSSLECFLCGSVGPKACDCPSRQSMVGMTVAQYRDQFVERYRLSGSKIDRVSMYIRFKYGLRPDIKSMLKKLTFRDFEDLVGAAERIEGDINEKKRLKEVRENEKKMKLKEERENEMMKLKEERENEMMKLKEERENEMMKLIQQRTERRKMRKMVRRMERRKLHEISSSEHDHNSKKPRLN